MSYVHPPPSHPDGNETITPEELKTLMERVLGGDIPQEQIDSIIKSIDADDSGTIDFDEFIDLMSDSKFDFLDEHKAAFEMFDKDGNGRISVHELKDVFGKLGKSLPNFTPLDESHPVIRDPL